MVSMSVSDHSEGLADGAALCMEGEDTSVLSTLTLVRRKILEKQGGGGGGGGGGEPTCVPGDIDWKGLFPELDNVDPSASALERFGAQVSEEGVGGMGGRERGTMDEAAGVMSLLHSSLHRDWDVEGEGAAAEEEEEEEGEGRKTGEVRARQGGGGQGDEIQRHPHVVAVDTPHARTTPLPAAAMAHLQPPEPEQPIFMFHARR